MARSRRTSRTAGATIGATAEEGAGSAGPPMEPCPAEVPTTVTAATAGGATEGAAAGSAPGEGGESVRRAAEEQGGGELVGQDVTFSLQEGDDLFEEMADEPFADVPPATPARAGERLGDLAEALLKNVDLGLPGQLPEDLLDDFDTGFMDVQPTAGGGGRFAYERLNEIKVRGSDGQVHTEQLVTSDVGDIDEGIREKKRVYCNSGGLAKLGHERWLGSSGWRRTKDSRLDRTREMTTNTFRGMNADDCNDFNLDFSAKRRCLPATPGGLGGLEAPTGAALGFGGSAASAQFGNLSGSLLEGPSQVILSM